MLCILPRHQVSGKTGKAGLFLEGYLPFCPHPFFAFLQAASQPPCFLGLWGDFCLVGTEMEMVLDILCFGNFFCWFPAPPQKPESIKAIMLGGPNREGRGRALQRLNEAGRGGKWLSPVVCCPGGSKVLTVVPQQTQEESMGGQKVNCKADGTSW